MDQIRSHVESMVEFHQGLENAYLLNGLICLICGTTHPDTAKKCHACKNEDLYSKICTPAHRIGEYFTALWSAGLWPPSEASRACSITEYATRIASLKFSLKHRCEVGKLCPLELGLELLNVKVQTTISSITGCALHNPDGNDVDNTA
jgi:ribosomal protein L40E